MKDDEQINHNNVLNLKNIFLIWADGGKNILDGSSGMDKLNKFYIDSLVHDSDSLNFLLDKVGTNQIALGTDYPFPLGETIPGDTIGKLKSISTKDRKRLLHGTALEWLDLDKKLFI